MAIFEFCAICYTHFLYVKVYTFPLAESACKENHSLLQTVAFKYSLYSALQNENLMSTPNLRDYWTTNLRYLILLLSIWFIASYVLGIFLAEPLNTIRIGGFKLGFWFAQQGSIYIFVVLIFVYVWLMNRLDKKYGVDE